MEVDPSPRKVMLALGAKHIPRLLLSYSPSLSLSHAAPSVPSHRVADDDELTRLDVGMSI